MAKLRAIAVPEGSLLARFGGAQDYRDAFCREVAGDVTLGAFITRFYCSAAFRPERVLLGLLGHGASSADAEALAKGETDRFAVWKVVERRETEILLHSPGTGTASWLAVEGPPSSSSEAVGQTSAGRKLLFGSWVGALDQSGWRFMLRPHQWYSRVLLGGC